MAKLLIMLVNVIVFPVLYTTLIRFSFAQYDILI